MSVQFDDLLDLARRLGIGIRHAKLGGSGGGLAIVRGNRLLFIDMDAEPEDQLQRTLGALAGLPELDQVFVRPDVREMLERFRG